MRSRHARHMFLLPLLAALLLSAIVPSAALAQDETDDAAAAEATNGDPPVAARDNFASAFFISYRTDTRGERTVELIGSCIIWFLLLLSATSLGLIGMMALTNQRKSIVPPAVVADVQHLLSAGRYREALELTETDQSFFSAVMNAALHEANHGFSAVIRSLEQTADELTTNRLRRIEYLNILGQVSPMIGLFGTVYGMILAFQAIVATGGDPDPVQLAGGIGTALTTTFWGLVVAIPALAGYALIRNKIDEMTTEATLAAEEIINQFRGRTGGTGKANPKENPRKGSGGSKGPETSS